MNERDALMRAAALCRGVSGRLHTDLMECKPGSTTARTLADMESGALHCIRKIEDAILALPETPRPEVATNDGYYLASFKDGRSSQGKMIWWGPGRCGYTPYLEQAGVYTKDDAEEIVKLCGAHTVSVPVAFVHEHESRLVDPGHERNRVFWTADDLRAAVSTRSPLAHKEKT